MDQENERKMEKVNIVLADSEGFGQVYDCECGCIHVVSGPVNLSFSPAGYMQFVEMLNRSAANFELRKAQETLPAQERIH